MDFLNVLPKDRPLALRLHLYIIGKQVEIQSLESNLMEVSKRIDISTMKLINQRIDEERIELRKAINDFQELQSKYKNDRLKIALFPLERVSEWM